MRLALLFVLAVAFVPAAVAHDSGRCWPRLEEVLLGDPDGILAGTVYHVVNDPDWTHEDWFYMESGAMPWVQTGASHLILDVPHSLLGVPVQWGHDHLCVWAVEAERDFLLY